MAVEREGVEFCLLGPLEARRNGEPVPLGGAKQRALLARLLVDAPAVVSTDTLVDDLWGEQPPDGALHTVQVVVSRLRKVLGPEALVTRAPGYLVVGDVDVGRFRQLVARARERREEGHLEAAVAQLAEALALWRGPPLAEFAYEAFAASHIERLEEERLAALEERIELELELGHHARLVGELEELCGAQPLRERLHEFLMLALYRSGRQSEALQVYAELRQRLVEELGLDPGASIQALERGILQHDVTLDAVASKRQPLPQGTVTFLFTDIEESTQRLHELGPEAYARALVEHRHLLRTAFAAHAGVEVDTQGDAFFVAFPTALGALAAATQAQAELADGPLRVRMALHTGTPLRADEGYVGVDVHRAARIAAAGHGGQVLVSASTAALAEDVPLRDLGEHRFKDLAAPERVYQLGEGDFDPLNTLYRTNLPVPATPFLGRERELAEVVGLLGRDDLRLLTLTGPGGTGKTRLGLEAVAALAEKYPQGVWWVPLASLRDPELVLGAAAQALGARDALAAHIGDKRLLMLFDNFEQVIDAADRLAELLASCPRLELLVTSREPLHLAGEQEYPVPPLAPDEGVDFFLARARAVDPAFRADDAVAAICRRLDELPLALELAAARVKALSPTQILDRLERRLPLLTGGPRDLPERHRTLRATIDWSYDLLSNEEQQLFRRLGVFAGGCTLEAVEDVVGAHLDTLQSLVEKSLVRFSNSRLLDARDDPGGRARAARSDRGGPAALESARDVRRAGRAKARRRTAGGLAPRPRSRTREPAGGARLGRRRR